MSRNGFVKRAEKFLAGAVTPIEKAHNATLKANARLNALNRRTADLAATNRSLKQSIVRRKTVEKALKKSEQHSQKLVEESHRLQNHLQDLTHQVLTAQEDKREKLSRNLQDEIAQTLLGINVRLLTLKKEAATTARDFKLDIARTQRLVEESVKSINRFARELDVHLKNEETRGNLPPDRPAIRMKIKSNNGKIPQRSVLRERISK